MDGLIRINLLDWREARRERRRRNFISALWLACIATGGAIAYMKLIYFGNKIDAQQARNDYLQEQIEIADRKMVELGKIKKERKNLIRRMHIIEDLQNSRSYIVHYMDQIVATLPDGVFLTSLDQKGDSTTLAGTAESNARVSDYMLNLDDSSYLADPRLAVIKSKGISGRRYADFTLHVSADRPANKTKTD